MIKVYYYNFKFWRAEVLRCGLYLQNIPFDNVVMDGAKVGEMKPKAPFRAFPIIELDDGKIMSQTPAMAAYVGKLGGIYDFSSGDATPDETYKSLYPSNDNIFAQFKCDEIMNACGDVTATIASTFSKENVEELRTALIKPDGGRLHMHLSGLDKIIGEDETKFACNGALTVADLCVWRLVAWLTGGVLDHIPKDFIPTNFPNLQAVYDNVESTEKVIEYMKEYHK